MLVCGKPKADIEIATPKLMADAVMTVGETAVALSIDVTRRIVRMMGTLPVWSKADTADMLRLWQAQHLVAFYSTLPVSCPLRALCSTSRAGRSVSVAVHEQLTRPHRACWATNVQMLADCKRHRPMVERAIAWLTGGARNSATSASPKNDASLKLAATAINLRQLIAAGLSHISTGWVVVT